MTTTDWRVAFEFTSGWGDTLTGTRGPFHTRHEADLATIKVAADHRRNIRVEHFDGQHWVAA